MIIGTALLLTFIAPSPASATTGIPQSAGGGGPVTGAVTMTSAAPVAVAVTMPTISIPGTLLLTYKPSPTIGLRWQACRQQTLGDNGATDCFWVPTSASADGTASQDATASWTQSGNTWSGSANVTFTPRNLATSPIGMFLVPHVRVYAVPTSGLTRPDPALNAEFIPSVATVLSKVQGPPYDTALSGSPSLSVAAAPISLAGSTGLTVTPAAASFPVGTQDSTITMSNTVTLVVCPQGANPGATPLSGWSETGGTPISRGMKGQVGFQATKGCSTHDVIATKSPTTDPTIAATPVPVALTPAELLLAPLSTGSTVQLAMWLQQTSTASQDTPQGFAWNWWGYRQSSAQSITISNPLPSKVAVPISPSGQTPPTSDAGAAGSAADNPSSNASTIAAQSGIDVATSTVSATAGATRVGGTRLTPFVRSIEKRGVRLPLKATLSPAASGHVRFTLVRVTPKGVAVVGKVKTANLRKGIARSSWILEATKPAGAYTVYVTWLPSKAGSPGITAWVPITIP